MPRHPVASLAVAAIMLIASAALQVDPVHAQRADTLVVEVRVDGIGSILTLASAGPDPATVRFSTREIFEFVGLPEPPMPSMDLTTLRAALGVDVVWVPSRLLLLVRDPGRTLPVTRAELDRLRAQSRARSAIPVEQRRPGPFMAVTVDEDRERLVDAGYSFGRLAGRWSNSTVSGNHWSLNANPASRLWLSYRDSDDTDPAFGVRLALGRAWVSADYDGEQVDAMGAAVVGPLVLFATTRERAVVTWRGPVQLQVGYAERRSVFRVAWGPVPLSPFSIPDVR